MTWHDVLFMHWPLPPARLLPLLPPGLELDLFEGRAFIGVVPFTMSGVGPRCVPGVPGLSAFPEVNVRTYVVRRGTPGVWFFSLDAGSRLAVRAARRLFHLPYFDATFDVGRMPAGGTHYRSRRTHRGAPPASLDVEYAPTGPATDAPAGSLHRWLSDRLCLYAADRRGTIFRADVEHGPWPLQPASVALRDNRMTALIDLALPEPPPLTHFARQLDVTAWWRERV